MAINIGHRPSRLHMFLMILFCTRHAHLLACIFVCIVNVCVDTYRLQIRISALALTLLPFWCGGDWTIYAVGDTIIYDFIHLFIHSCFTFFSSIDLYSINIIYKYTCHTHLSLLFDTFRCQLYFLVYLLDKMIMLFYGKISICAIKRKMRPFLLKINIKINKMSALPKLQTVTVKHFISINLIIYQKDGLYW